MRLVRNREQIRRFIQGVSLEMPTPTAMSVQMKADKLLRSFGFHQGGVTMRPASSLISRFVLGIFALAISLGVTETSEAGGLDDSRPNRCQWINPGSYSPCHYWFPTFYTCRAYHRPARLYDQAEWDMDGNSHSTSGNSCSSDDRSPALQNQANGKN